MLSKGQSLKGCFFLHFEQNIAKACSCSSFFLFAFSTSTCVPNVLKRSVSKFSNRLPISALVIPPAADFAALELTSLLPAFDLHLEYF
jgi:hypothetical protein